MVKYITFQVLVGQYQYWQNICTCCTGDSDYGFLENQNSFPVDVEKRVLCGFGLWNCAELCCKMYHLNYTGIGYDFFL